MARTSGKAETSQPTPISALALSPDGTRIATGDADGRVRVIDRATEACVLATAWQSPAGRDRPGVQRLAFSRDGAALVGLTGGDGPFFGPGRLCAVHAASGATWFETRTAYEAFALAPDREEIAVVRDGRLERLHARDGTSIGGVELPEGLVVLDLAWSADGNTLAATYRDLHGERSGLAVLDGRSFVLHARRDVSMRLFDAPIAFDPEGRIVVVAVRDAPAVVTLDPGASDAVVRLIEGLPAAGGLSCALLPARGEAVLVDPRSHTSTLVDVRAARVLRALAADTRVAAEAAGGALAVTAHGIALRLWDRAWTEQSTTHGRPIEVRPARSPTATAPATPPSGDEAALLAAILANPDDDAPRLVLADLLIARGDPRGELIVLMCGPQTREVRVRVRALLDAGWKTYAGELAPYAWTGAFARGFVDRVTMTVAAFARHGERVFGEHPVHTLVVKNDRLTEAELEKLARVPALAKVRGLELDISKGDPPPLAPLARSPHLGRLESLVLSHCGHSPADWQQLFATLAAPALARVRIVACRTSATIARAIAANPALAKLRELQLWTQYLLDDAATDHAPGAYRRLADRAMLERLAVEYDRSVGDVALAAFFEDDRAAALRALVVRMTAATDGLLYAIARSPKLAVLEELVLHDRGTFSLDGVTAILQSPHARVLRRLVMSADWPADAVRAYEQLLLALPASHPLRRVAIPGRAPASAALRARFEVRAD